MAGPLALDLEEILISLPVPPYPKCRCTELSSGPGVWTKGWLSPTSQLHPDTHTSPSESCAFAGTILGTSPRSLQRGRGRSGSPRDPPSALGGRGGAAEDAGSDEDAGPARDRGGSGEPGDGTTKPCPAVHSLGPSPASDHGWFRFNRNLTGRSPLLPDSASWSRLETVSKEEQSPWGLSDSGPGFVPCIFSSKPPQKLGRCAQWPAPNR